MSETEVEDILLRPGEGRPGRDGLLGNREEMEDIQYRARRELTGRTENAQDRDSERDRRVQMQ